MKQLSYMLTFVGCLGAASAFAQVNRGNMESAASFANTAAISRPEVQYTNNTTTRQTVEIASPSANYTRPVAAEHTTASNYNATEKRYNNSTSSATVAHNAATSVFATSSASSNSNSPLPSAVSRYSPAIKKPFLYHTSRTSTNRTKTHRNDAVKFTQRRAHQPWAGITADYGIWYCPVYIYDDLFYDTEPETTDESCMNASFDGYMVYQQDTLSGIVTINGPSVTLEQPVNASKEYSYKTVLNDSYLKEIALFRGTEELYMVRLPDDDQQLWRVLHTGKLNIYDDQYSFPETNNINKSHLRLSFAGQQPMLVKSKAQLIAALNKAYGLNLKAKNYSWKELLEYIDKLD